MTRGLSTLTTLYRPMPTNPPATPVSTEALGRRHESRNPDAGWLLLVGGLVLVLVLGSLLTVRGVMRLLDGDRSPVWLTVQPNGIIATNLEPFDRFPRPRLQVQPHQDLATFRAWEEIELTTYGWIDRTNGIVRIPIARAIDLLLERGVSSAATNRPAGKGPSSLDLIRERSQSR